MRESEFPTQTLPKSPTGVNGFDEITFGGLPKGRPSLVCGGAGSGKTLFGMEFLVHGATKFNEPGVFLAFEETEKDLVANFASLGFDLTDLQERKLIDLDHVRVERSEIEETGEYDLEGLFVRLNFAIDRIGAKRVVLDTLESLFAGFTDTAVLRAELRRLFNWLKEKGVTAVITAEQGEGKLTRYGIEEYVSDCVILLDHRVQDQMSTRRLRVVKYRGSLHGTNEYPFLIDQGGFSVLPITSVGLDYDVSSDRISTGIERLDGMLNGGIYKGSSILVSGAAGTGKTSIAASMADGACRRGERCLYYAFEESSTQIIRNMRSIGLDLAPWVESGLLRFRSLRPTLYGLEMQLTSMNKLIEAFEPDIVILDPVSNLISVGESGQVKSTLMRLVDHMKEKQITSLFTSLSSPEDAEQTVVGVSSLMDTWIMLHSIEIPGERDRGISVIKSRGTAHSNQIREFLLTDHGIELKDVYVGASGVLTGTARAAQEAKDEAEALARQGNIERKRRELERKRDALEAQIALLKARHEADEDALKREIKEEEAKQTALKKDREEMATLRKADAR